MSPRQNEKLFPFSYHKDLLSIARGDLGSAKILFLHHSDDARNENVAYMAQQTMEKSLKAVLVYKKIAVPLVHDLGVLIAKLPDDLNPDFGYELSELTLYATIRRYEEGAYSPTKDELEEIIKLAEKVYDWSKATCA